MTHAGGRGIKGLGGRGGYDNELIIADTAESMRAKERERGTRIALGKDYTK